MVEALLNSTRQFVVGRKDDSARGGGTLLLMLLAMTNPR